MSGTDEECLTEGTDSSEYNGLIRMIVYDSHYYDGAWQAPAGHETTDVVSSATETTIGRVPLGTPDDVDRAVQAARQGFDRWSRVPLEERAEWLERLAAALKPRVPRIAESISHEVGTALSFSTKVQVEFPIMMIGMNARFIRSATLEEELGHSLVVKEPVGVVGCITPWNYPLHQVVCKIAPALAAGCTVVLKPAELAPLSAGLLAEAAHEIGLPPGVLNVVFGAGRVVGEALVAHPGIDMVSFTGSLTAGRRVASIAGDGIKKVCLELGGKSAFIVLDDAPFEKAVPAGVNNCMQNSGQTCSAWTRMLVPRTRHDDAVEIARAQLAKLTLGDPFDAATKLGPLASATQRDRVLGYIETERRRDAGCWRRPADEPAHRLLRRADDLRECRAPDDDRAGGDLRSCSERAALRHGGRCGADGERFHLRTVRRRLVGDQGAGAGCGPPAADRAGRHQRRAFQRAGAVWRLQEVRRRAGDRADGAARVLSAEGDPAVGMR
jgi:aldehyde dehydrogenase (NAD+)